MDILLLTVDFASIEAPASSSSLTLSAALMLAARYGTAETVKLLLKAGASIEAKTSVSKRISICTCVYVYVCESVIFFHHSVYDM